MNKLRKIISNARSRLRTMARQLTKGLNAVDAHKGNQRVSRGKERYTLTQERSDHRRKHKDEGISNEQIAKTLTRGKIEKDGKQAVAYRENSKIIKQGSAGKGADITTAYKEHDFRTHTKKKPGQEPSSTGR